MEAADAVVVGAGLAGLACALHLQERGATVVVVERGDRPGGRVRTDEVDGFRCDRGFQVVLTAYPELTCTFAVDDLDLRPFDPGALVRVDGRFHLVADPLRRPGALLSTVRAPVGSPADKLALLGLVASVRRGPAARLLRRPDGSTAWRLGRAGIGSTMVERFLGPLVGGFELDPDLTVSRRRFDLVWRMLAEGAAAVPAEGMGALPAQLARRLSAGSVRLATPVAALDGTTVVTEGGERIDGRAVIVATEGPVAARLLGLPDPGSRPAAALWLAADDDPVGSPVLVLDGDRSGPARNLAAMSTVAPTYAPAGRTLLVAAVPGRDALRPGLVDDVRAQLASWYGPRAARWSVVRHDVIAHGQPLQTAPFDPQQPVDLGDGIFVCGDHRDTASIQGALHSGRRAARAVARHLGLLSRS